MCSNYDLFCLTEDTWKSTTTTYGADAPTDCPTDPAHTINLDSVQITGHNFKTISEFLHCDDGIKIGGNICDTNGWIDDHSNGETTKTLYIGDCTIDVTDLSDIRTKENIKSTIYKDSDILDLRIVDFTYKKDKNKPIKRIHSGMIAQELEKLEKFKKYVKVRNDKDKNKMIEYKDMIPFLLKVCQDQQKKINEMDKKLKTLI